MKPAKRASPSKKYPPGSFMYKVRKRRIIETLAAFIGGGWLTWEAVHWILVEHYHFPEKLLDITLVTIIGAMLCTLTWRWLGGREKKPRGIKLEFILIPLFVLITVYLNVRFIQQFGEPEYISVHEPKELIETRAENSVAVMYFENNTGDESLDYWRKALSDLIIADLSQSKYIQVLSGEQLYNILKKLDQVEAESYSSDVLNEVAARGRARNILTGNYVKAGELFQINIRLQEAGTGRLIGSESVEGKGVESILSSMVDELTRRVKTSFELTEEQITGDIDSRIEDITTSSPEALKHYLEGVRYEYMGEPHLSLPEIEKAIALDPNFAMAYLFMHHNYFDLNNSVESEKYLQKAYELSEQLPARERYLIQGTFYSRSENTYDKAIEAFNKLLEFYPEHIEGNIMLGNVYWSLEQWDKASERFELLIENKIEPIYPYTNLSALHYEQGMYDNAAGALEEYLNNFGDNPAILGDLTRNYLLQGKYDLAQAEVDKATSLNLTGSNRSPFRLQGNIYVCRNELTLAEKEYLKLLDSEELMFQYQGRKKLADLYILQGKFRKAQAQIKQNIELANRSGDMRAKSFGHRYLSYLYLISGSPEKALEECNKAWKVAVDKEDLLNQREALHLKGMIHLEMKSVEEAEREATELKEMIEKGLNKMHIRMYYHLAGTVELERKNFDQAIDFLKEALSLLPVNKLYVHINLPTEFRHSLAQAYYESGDLEKSQEAYEGIISRPDSILRRGDIYAKSVYMLGKIYEQIGWEGKAIEQYEKFLDLWKNADPGIAEVEDARERLAGLRG